jgi:hypothetical protein
MKTKKPAGKRKRTPKKMPARRKKCNHAHTTYMQVGTDRNGETIWGLCCKSCFAEVGS